MRTPAQIEELSRRLVSLSNRLVALEYVRAQNIAAITADVLLSDQGKAGKLAELQSIAEMQALFQQIQVVKAELDPEESAWAVPMQVLRQAAMPAGMTAEYATIHAALKDEAAALEKDPGSLQAAILDAAASKDWLRLYTLTLGRVNGEGFPLSEWAGRIQGIYLKSLDLPGEERVMEALFNARVAFWEAEQAWGRASGKGENYTTASLLLRAKSDFEAAKKARRDRLKLSPLEAMTRAEAEQGARGARFVRIDETNNWFVIFDSLTGDSRYVPLDAGPEILQELNALAVPPVA